MSIQLCVPVTESSQPAAARRAAVDLAREAGVDDTTISRVALVVTELAMNLVKHATGGELLVRGLDEGVEVLALDRGPGIADVGRALRDGYSTAGSPGTGLGAMQRTAGEFDLYSEPGKGTALVARVFSGRRRAATPARPVGVVHQAKRGESVCGDDWIVRWFRDGWVCAVADGLGHGLLAAAAARAAVLAVQDGSGKRGPAELVKAAHEAVKPTRGAAFGVAVMDAEAQVVRFAGIGNVAAVVVAGEERRHLVSRNGILGHSLIKAVEVSQPWRKQSVLLLHSDGIGSQWDLRQYPGLSSRDPSLIAGVLYRDHARGHDDATVVVVKE